MRLRIVLQLAFVEHVLEEAAGDCLVLGFDFVGLAGNEPGEGQGEQQEGEAAHADSPGGVGGVELM
jgi:hypothetical protein